MVLASSLMFIQCTSDPIQGPQGTAGIDGVNGTDGTNGVDGTASCVACHSDTHRDPIYASYDLSGHAGGGAVGYAGSRASCAQCHSNEGYVLYQERGETSNFDNPTRIDCKTCHSEHSTFDFENDGADYALRTVAPVTLMTDASYTMDFGGTSNMCIDCHQPRRTPPTSTDGSFEITSSHWGPHHGPQSTVLEGIQGAMIPGTEGYPGIGSAKHRTAASCVQCHMSADDGGNDGMHSWIKTDNGCTGCHSSGIPSEASGFTADMEILAGLLEDVVGWEYVYEEDADGELVEDVNGDPIKVLDMNGDPVIRDVHAIVHDGHPNSGSQGQGATFTITESEAAWNWLLLTEDNSNGTHNPDYSKALIANSIEALTIAD